MSDLPALVRELTLMAFPLLLAVTLHEGAHGYVADRLGDPTPRLSGRLTLNPLAHLDLVGTLVFVLTQMIGWAKPVPVNPRYFRNPRRDMVWVSLAGPAANLALAVVFGLAARGLLALPVGSDSWAGSRLVTPLALMAVYGVSVNLGLGLFNLLPVPPLDGGHILAGFLPAPAAAAWDRLERFGFLLLLVVVFSGILDRTLYPVLRLLRAVLLGSAVGAPLP